MNHKHTYRLYLEQGLQVRTKKRQKLHRRDRIEPTMPEHPMQRSSQNFMSDQLVDHRRFRILNIVGDHSRFCPGQIVDVSITGARLAQYLDDLALLHGLPEEIVLGNGPEGTSHAMFEWSECTGVLLVRGALEPMALRRSPSNQGSRCETRLRRELQRQSPRRIPEPALVQISTPCSRGNRPDATRGP